jgi:hypothetical protein
MNLRNRSAWYLALVFCLVVVLSACGGTPEPETESAPSDPTAAAPESAPAATATPTPTPEPAGGLVPPTDAPASRCQGVAGQLEVQVLVGPAEAVGLEPVAVGSVPFSTITSEPPYLIEGEAPVSYEAVLEEEWGTYTVTMDLETTVQGECSGEAGSEQLALVLEMAGEQFVEVNAEGFHGEYPWSGTQSRDLAFPLEEGATAEGEGWAVVLHLGSR